MLVDKVYHHRTTGDAVKPRQLYWCSFWSVEPNIGSKTNQAVSKISKLASLPAKIFFKTNYLAN